MCIFEIEIKSALSVQSFALHEMPYLANLRFLKKN